jgi:kynurenine formamidase
MVGDHAGPDAGTAPSDMGGLGRVGRRELLEALGKVQEGRIYELATELGEDMPQGPSDTFYGFRLTPYRTPKCLTGRKDVAFDFSMEVITASPHLGTHIDGLAHIQSHGRIYGGHRVGEVYSDSGWLANGMEHSRPIIGRGILLDVAAAKGVAHLPDSYEITPDDLVETAQTQGSEVRSGDVVLVRTGWLEATYDSDPAAFFRSQPGVGPDAGVWLYERGMSVLGTDTSGTEPKPMPDPERSTHCALLVDRGVHLIEIMRLENIARDQIFEFLFIALPLRIKGGTGSWVRPVALV